MGKYVINRQNICAGLLVKPLNLSFKIYDSNGIEISKEKLEEYGITDIRYYGDIVCRGMLLSVNEDGLANDLIYTTPEHYQIQNIEPKTEARNDFIIKHYIELEELLKYLGFNEELTQEDLNKIFKKLITSPRWLNFHKNLFTHITGSKIGYRPGGKIVFSKEFYDNLGSISCIKSGKPHYEEPGYSLIKRKSIF